MVFFGGGCKIFTSLLYTVLEDITRTLNYENYIFLNKQISIYVQNNEMIYLHHMDYITCLKLCYIYKCTVPKILYNKPLAW